MRQKVGKSGKAFPLRGSAGQAAVEATIDNQILAYGIRDRPEIPNRIAAQERLGEVPQLGGDGYLLKRMRNRNGLAKLRPSHVVVAKFVQHAVQVEVEAGQIVADQQNQAVLRRAEVHVGRSAGVNMFEVAEGDRRTPALAGQRHRLPTEENISGIKLLYRTEPAVDQGLALHQELQPRMHRQLRDLIDAHAA